MLKSWNHLSFVNIGPTLVAYSYVNGKVFTSTTTWKPKNLNFFSKKVEIEFWLVLKSWNHLSFVNIGPTLVAYSYVNGKVFTSTTTWKPKNLNFFSQKVEIEFWLVLKSWNHLSFVNIGPTLVAYSYVNGKVFTSTTTWKPKNCNFFSKKGLNWILTCILTCSWKAIITSASSISVLD